MLLAVDFYVIETHKTSCTLQWYCSNKGLILAPFRMVFTILFIPHIQGKTEGGGKMNPLHVFFVLFSPRNPASCDWSPMFHKDVS